MKKDPIEVIDSYLDAMLACPLMWAPQSLVFESLVYQLLSLRIDILDHDIDLRKIELRLALKLLGRSPGPLSTGSLLRDDFGEDSYTNSEHEHHEQWIGFYTEFVKLVRERCAELEVPPCYVCDGSGMRVTRDGSQYDCYRCKGVGSSGPHAAEVLFLPLPEG